MSFKPFKTQREFADLWHSKPRLLNLSGCGTGKTLSCIHAVKTYYPWARVLVLAPLSILKNAWQADIEFGWPETTSEIAYAKNRKKVFENENQPQWIITNHDAVKTIAKEGWETKFDIVIVDEADAFRNKDSQRSKAMQKVAYQIPSITLMTGTPTPKSVTDIWHLAYLVDFGERLGKNFFGFRAQVCTPSPIPGAPDPRAMKWDDKPEANDLVTSMLSDITYRVQLEDVTELPEKITRSINVELPAKLRKDYEAMRKESLMLLESGELITAIHAGARMQKLLQLVSGGIYNDRGEAKDVHPDRHKLVLDLVEETDHALVAFNWKHQKDGLVKEAKKRKVSFAVIDGEVKVKDREAIVERFQRGELQVIFAQPQSAGHGLTLTKANRVIWASPQYRADLYEQFNHRIYRTGQKRKTEVIHIAAEHTMEVDVYNKLMGKKFRMDDLLKTISDLAEAA